MLTNILWMIEAKLQYERQKAQGLAGLLAILFVIFMVWKWDDWFYPLFDKLGFVDFANRIGLVHELPAVTVINVLVMIGITCFFIALSCFAVVFIGFLFLMFGASKLGQNIITIALLPLLPFLLFKSHSIRTNVMSGIASNRKELKEIIKKYKDLNEKERLFRYYLHQLEHSDSSTKIDIWEGFEWGKAKSYLNRAIPSIKENNVFLIGYQKGLDKLYIIFPTPLPEVISRSFYNSSKERGIYGFESQCLRASLKINPYVSEPYEVPAIEVSIKSTVEEFYMEVGTEVIPVDLKCIERFYKVSSSSELNSIVHDLSANHLGMQNALLQAHVAYYLFPIVFDEANDNLQPGIEKCLEQRKDVLNADALYPVYDAMVREKIVEFAKKGEQWAINWFQKVE